MPNSAEFDVVVVGASVAGVRVAESLRQEGQTGSIVMIGDEPELPYDRPPLSKHFLAGTWDRDRIRLLTDDRASQLGIELRLGVAATGLDPAGHQVELADGSRITYRTVVVATGASARPSPWGLPPGVFTLRNLADSERLAARLSAGARVVVVGGGYIGAEVAATAIARGCSVTVVDAVANPYARSLGESLGAMVSSIHDRHGVPAHYGVGVAGIRTAGASLVVELADGSSLPADTVVVGIGAVPNTGWLADSGVVVEDGVRCDEFGRALGVADVYAVGDVARWERPHGRVGTYRHEHWTNSVDQARAVAHNIARPHDLTPSAGDGYVWSDQYDWKIQLVGEPGPDLRCEIVGSLDSSPARLAGLFGDEDGVLVGAATVNWPKAFLAGRRGVGVAKVDDLAASLRELLSP